MQSFMPIIVVIYLVVSVIGAVLQSLKNSSRAARPESQRFNRLPNAPRPGCRRRHGIRQERGSSSLKLREQCRGR